jgi:transcription elongation GreA/GreB family factor
MANMMRCPGSQVLHRQPMVLNLDKVIQFMLGDQILERRLVLTANEPTEISTASPVGHKLGDAKPGDTFTVSTFEGRLVVKVLVVGGVAAMRLPD